MQEDLLQFKLQEVWTLVDLPNGKRAIGTKWVFKNKKNERGIVIKNKARLVAQGYTQEEGIDYDEVFAPVARIEAIRLFLAYALFKDFVVYQMDVKMAFLYGKIKEEVYVISNIRMECNGLEMAKKPVTFTLLASAAICKNGGVTTKAEIFSSSWSSWLYRACSAVGRTDYFCVTFKLNPTIDIASGLGRLPTWQVKQLVFKGKSSTDTIDHLGKFDGKADEGFFVGTVPVKDCTQLPLWTADPPFSQSSKSSPDAGFKPSGDDEKKVTEEPGKEGGDSSKDSESNDQEKEDNVNSTNTVNAASTNEVNVVGAKTSIELPDDPNMPELEDIVYSDDDEDVGAEADMNNLDAFIPVSPIPTTRVHKDHPVEQIIRDLNSAPQTRRMTKNLEEHGLFSSVQQRTNHKDFQNCLFACFLSQEEPKKVIHALKDPSWIEAMQEELLQFKLQEVWTLVDLPNGKRAIGTKWVFRNKKDERGIVIKNKARLVAQGYTQEEWIEYDEVFAPVARIEAIRLFLAYASFKDFVVYQMDVNSAFLYGKIEKEIYVCQPPGFEDPDFPDIVYKVEKALYGLHQAPRAWYEALSTYLLDNGFQRGKIDKTLFIRRDKGDILLVQVYVDDIIFGSTKKSLCTEFEKMMHKKFQMSSMGELTFFLGLWVKQKEDGIFIVRHDEDGKEVDVHLYRSMIGSLMYLTSSRPDIMFAVSYTDSDYAGASLDRKSTTGGCQFPWQCKKHNVVANYTTKAKYVAASSCCGQVLWIQNQSLDYGHNLLLLLKVNAARHNLLLLLKVNAASMVKNLDNAGKCLMYPRFVQVFLDKQLEGMQSHKRIYVTPSHTKKIFGNMRRVGKDFSRKDTSLFPTMMVQAQQEQDEGSGHRRQETMGDTIARTRFENVSKTSNDLLPRREYKDCSSSGDYKFKLRVKKLEKKKRSRTHKLKRLYKVGRSARVISSNEASLGDQEDASKQGRKIDDIDKDAEITLVHETQGRYGDEEMFDTGVLDGDEVLAEPEVTIKDVNLSVDEVTLAQALAALKSAKVQEKANVVEEPSESITTTPTLTTTTAATTITAVSTRPRAKGLVIHEEEQATTPTVSSQQPSQVKAQDKGKGIMVEEPMKMKKKDQISLDEELAFKLQAEEEEEERLAREKA
ncbi:putative ribonuclease H-like domain-containing protein [Tanacetum coccineum]